LENINLLSIAVIAFLGSFGHCIGMCGGIVIAYSSSKFDNNTSKTTISLMHIVYSLGRVSTYILLGAIFGFVGGVATFNNIANGILLIVAGIFMILTSFSLMGKLKFLTNIEYSVSKMNWYQKLFKTLLASKTPSSFFMLGVLNGLLPCGFVYFFAITAASTADPFWGGVVMGIFGISTIPALFSLGFFVGLFTKNNLRNTMIKLASVAVFVYAIFTIYNGIDYITHPKKSLTECHGG
jgi:sulfite exporter TauE/SafE